MNIYLSSDEDLSRSISSDWIIGN